MKKLIPGVNYVTNSEYHADTSWYSSSSLKKILNNTEDFNNEYILGKRVIQTDNNSFQEGSLTHSLILEPHLVKSEYAIYQGMRKAGSEWEAFKTQNTKPSIVSLSQWGRCEQYVKSYKKNDVAMGLIQGGLPEHSICHIIEDMPLKVRCDYINLDKRYIVDVKTSSYPVDLDNFRHTIIEWKYDLSAALYLNVVEAFYNCPFDFYFIANSKKELQCEAYKVSAKTRSSGTRMVNDAISLYKKCKETGIWSAPKEAVEAETKHEILEV